MQKIGFQDGIEAARQRWNALDKNRAWPDKLAATLRQLKSNSNELTDADVVGRIARLELAVEEVRQRLPFPASS